MWYDVFVDKIQIVHSFKGGKAVAMTMEIVNYLAHPYVNTTHRTVIGALLKVGVYDETSALGIDEITKLAAYSDRDYVGKALNALTVERIVIQFRAKDRRKKFYLNRDFSSPISPTALPEMVFKKVEPVACEAKVTKPKEKKPSGKIQETFDLFNEELVKVLGETKKLKVLNDKRKKDVQKLIDLNLDLRAMFKGFFLDRKELENDHIDFHYILRNPERYLHKGSANKQVDNHLLLKKKQKYLNYVMDGKNPEQFGLKREELGVTDQEIQKAKERYEYEKELLG